MIFREQKTTDGFTYIGEDVRGKVHITSKVALDGTKLDHIFSAVTSSGQAAGNIGEHITFTFSPLHDHVSTIDIFTIIPDLKEGTTLEQLIAAFAQSMTEEQLKRFRAALTAMGRIELDTDINLNN